MAENFTEVGIEATVKGFASFLVKLEAMNKAIAATGVTAAAASAGAIALKLALAGIVLIATGVALAIGAIVTALGFFLFDSLQIAASVESAFAGVAKTTDGLIDGFGRMTEAGEKVKEEFRALALVTPIPLEGLLKIGEFAGQLGIAKDNLADFSSVVAKLGVSTELSTEEAAIGLARLAGIYEVSIEDMVDNTERLGSTITFLGNKFKTNEPLILNFSKRIAGIANLVGISQAEILGFGAAITSAGVEAQLGSTAIQNTIIAMSKAVSFGGEKLDKFAEISGKTSEEFVESWRDDAANAVVEFVEGLGELGEGAFAALEDVGLAADRTERALLPLAAAGDLLRSSIEGGNQAWEDNNELTREAAIRYNTLESQVEIAKNGFRDFALQIGDPLKDALKDLLKNSIIPLIEELSGPLVTAFEKSRDAVVDELLPALGDLLRALGFDITTSTLIDGIANLGDTIADGVGALADFVEDVTNLVDIFNEGGAPATLAEFLGIEEGDAELILDVAASLVIFGIALKGIGIAAGIAGGLTVAGTGLGASILIFAGEVGAFLALAFGGEGFIATVSAALVGSIGLAFGIAFAALLAVWIIFGDRFLENVGPFWDQVVIISTEIWERFVETLVIIWEGIVTIWEGILQRILDALGIDEEMKEEWRSIWEDMQAILDEILPPMLIDIIDFVADILLLFTTGQISTDVVDGLVVPFEDAAKTLSTDTLPFLLQTIVTFLQDIGPDIREEADKWPKEIDGVKPKFKTAGRNVMQGLLDGFKAEGAAIIRFITNLASSIVRAIKRVLGIESPSKIFEDIGVQINLGLAKGILESVKFPELAMANVASRTIDAGAQFAAPGRGASSSIDRSFTIENFSPNYVDRQSPTSLVDDLSLINTMRGG